MKNIRLTFFVLILLSFSVCKAQVNDGVTFNKEFETHQTLRLGFLFGLVLGLLLVAFGVQFQLAQV